MNENFDKAFDFVLLWEGNYSNDANDPGGETKYGISKRAYPNLEIKELTVADAKEIYKTDYWQKCGCDNLEYPIDIIVFDTAVNMGVGRAKIILEKSSDWKDYLMHRIAHYADISSKNPMFLRGWINRVYSLYKKVIV